MHSREMKVITTVASGLWIKIEFTQGRDACVEMGRRTDGRKRNPKSEGKLIRLIES